MAGATFLRDGRAQAPVPAAATREISGLVSRAAGERQVPAAKARVVLHRVGGTGSGPLDSTLTGGDGSYRFRYRPDPDTNAVYIVSSRWEGIAYFTSPFHARNVRGGDADIVLYDTTSAPVEVHIRSRHVIVSAPDSARSRQVMEVFVISNDSSVTRVAARDGYTFEILLPDGARDPTLGPSDVAAEGVLFSRGRARVVAPLAPGMKRVTIQYQVAANAAPFELARAGGALILEVLVEDPRATARGGGLSELAAASLEGRTFRRFLAQNVASGAAVTVIAPSVGGGIAGSRAVWVVIAVGAALLLALGATVSRRGPLFRRRAPAGDPDRLAREIAALDAAFERRAAPTADERADHYQRRAHLKASLTAALAKRDGLT